MAVSEEDVKEQEIINEDFRKAQEIMDRIVKEFVTREFDKPILFTLCLIYCMKSRR
jgi:hypothetical protein